MGNSAAKDTLGLLEIQNLQTWAPCLPQQQPAWQGQPIWEAQGSLLLLEAAGNKTAETDG